MPGVRLALSTTVAIAGASDATTVIPTWAVLELPCALVTCNNTGYTPGPTKVCEAVAPVAGELPSENTQLKAKLLPLGSVLPVPSKLTAKGGTPVVPLAWICAVGAALTKECTARLLR